MRILLSLAIVACVAGTAAAQVYTVPGPIYRPIISGGTGYAPRGYTAVQPRIAYSYTPGVYVQTPRYNVAVNAGYTQPGTIVYGTNTYAPTYATPTYATPTYATPVYNTVPSYTPTYTTPAYSTVPSYTPTYTTPTYNAVPTYTTQPIYTQPSYAVPQVTYAQPSYAPTYQTPQYSTVPSYSPTPDVYSTPQYSTVPSYSVPQMAYTQPSYTPTYTPSYTPTYQTPAYTVPSYSVPQTYGVPQQPVIYSTPATSSYGGYYSSPYVASSQPMYGSGWAQPGFSQPYGGGVVSGPMPQSMPTWNYAPTTNFDRRLIGPGPMRSGYAGRSTGIYYR